MAQFNYIAKNKNGEDIRAALSAENRLEALETLRKKGLVVIDLINADSCAPAAAPRLTSPDAASAAGKDASRFQLTFDPKVRLTDLSIFCRQLAISVNAGVALRDALESIGMEMEHVVLKRTIQDMVERLHEGMSLSSAVARHPEVFNDMFRGLIKVAEESGQLPSTLDEMAEYMEKADRLQRRIKAMAAYPAFIGVFFVLVCLVMTLFILPKFTDIFGGLGSELPAMTRVVFGINQFFIDNIIPVAVVIGGCIAGIIMFARTPNGRYWMDQFAMKIPKAGDCVQKYALARFCRSLSIMVHSGVPITVALEICADGAANQVLRKSVLSARDRIMNGNRIAESLGQRKIFPGLVIRMVSVGEESGQLPEVLDKVSDLYEDQVEVSVMAFMALFEPLIICIFGAFILVMVLAIYLPVFSVSGGMH